MKEYCVDFETYYSKSDKISASDIGVPNYASVSDAYMVSIVGEDASWVGTIEEAQQKFPPAWWSDPTHQYVAANANFDQRFAEKYFYPAGTVRPWKCVLDRAAASQLPGNVAALSKTILGLPVDKTMRDWMDGKRFEELSPDDQKALFAYCHNDAREEWNIWNKLPHASPTEDALAEHTRAVNRRGVCIDTELLSADKTRLHEFQHTAYRRIPWHNTAAPLSPKALAEYCNAKGIPVPESLDKRNEDTTELMNVHPALADVVGSMRAFRRANTLIKKIESIEARLTPSGVLPLEMMYCGARHTRRWSSRGVNVQNLDREPYRLSFDDEGGQTVWSRAWVIPRPGHVFLSLDYAQIEPRCLHWLTGNEPLLELIRSGFSVYEAYARVAKNWKGDKGTLKKELGVAAYTLIKNEVLGLGYGMGAAKYESYAGVDTRTAKLTVDNFRRANLKILQLWKRFDELIAKAANSRDELAIEMPTGDFLRHFNVRAAAKYGGYESFTTLGDFGHSSHQPSLWGGTLTENVVQRMARDVLGNAIVQLERAGFVIPFTAHDEIVLEVPIAGREEAKREAIEIMTKAPEWAEGLPLGVEGDFSDRYTK